MNKKAAKASTKIVEGIEISTRSSLSYVKQFLPYYRPYKKYLICDMLCALIASASELVFPMLVGDLTDGAIGGSLILSAVLKVAAVLVVVKLLEVLTKFYINKYGHVMGVYIETDLRNAMFDHLQKLPHTYYDNNKVGTLMSRLTSDLFDITEFSHHCPEELFISTVKIIGAFTILMFYNVWLTLCVFAMLPFMIWFSIGYNSKWDANYKATRVQMGEINAQAEDTLSGIRVVKSFTNEDVEAEKFGQGNKKFINVKKKSYHYMGTYNAGIIALSSVMYIMIIVLGGVFKISPGMFVTYLLFATTLLNSVVKLADYTEQFQKGITAFARFQEIMDTPIAITDAELPQELTNVDGKIEFCDVSFRYSPEGEDVLSHLNIKLNKGDVVAIVGASGVGKTTIANLIPRFYEVSGGAIKIDGKDIRTLSLKSLRGNIGIVQQDVYMFYGTVADNIRYGKTDATDEEIVIAAKLAGVDEFVNKLPLKYNSIVGERGVKLSGGQKQRISIARVFLKNPPILILDEATSALDNESEIKVQQSLDKLSHGRTSIIIAHRLSTIRNATNILVLGATGIVESGTHKQLMEQKGEYAKLYNMSLAQTTLRQ